MREPNAGRLKDDSPRKLKVVSLNAKSFSGEPVGFCEVSKFDISLRFRIDLLAEGVLGLRCHGVLYEAL
jgi:hypothetical protein